MNQENFWRIRAEKYNKLDWVNEISYLQAFVLAAGFSKEDCVLDVGAGTGVIAHAVAPLVKEVIGLDISQAMLHHGNWKDNKYFIKRDVREPIFHSNVFDKVTARMVFHHITEGTSRAMDECYKVTKNGGKMILSEGIPPAEKFKDFCTEIFKLKEERLTFLGKDLVDLMKNSGFKNVKVIPYMMKNTSVRNWLENNCLTTKQRNKIFKMYTTAPADLKKAYHMKIINNDCLIDVTNLILVGEK